MESTSWGPAMEMPPWGGVEGAGTWGASQGESQYEGEWLERAEPQTSRAESPQPREPRTAPLPLPRCCSFILFLDPLLPLALFYLFLVLIIPGFSQCFAFLPRPSPGCLFSPCVFEHSRGASWLGDGEGCQHRPGAAVLRSLGSVGMGPPPLGPICSGFPC